VHLSSFFLMTPRPPLSTLFPYTTLFRSVVLMTGDSPQRIGATAFARSVAAPGIAFYVEYKLRLDCAQSRLSLCSNRAKQNRGVRSEEHTSELQSRRDLVCRLLLEKKKKK